jgi:hypothetical protein
MLGSRQIQATLGGEALEGIDRIILRYVYKLLTLKFRDKCDQQNRLKPNIKGGLDLYTDRSKTNKRH